MSKNKRIKRVRNTKAATDYHYADNSKYTINKEYEPEHIKIRKYDANEDKYIREVKVINHKEDWDNQHELLEHLGTIGGKIKLWVWILKV